MQVKKLSNGQIEVTHESLTLVQTIGDGIRFNDCSENKGDYIELCSQHDERFKPLFVALHNFKIQQ